MNKQTVITIGFIFVSTFFALAQSEIQGTITAVKGKQISIKPDGVYQQLSKTDTCVISKDLSGTKNPFGITVQSGWMSVAEALFVSEQNKQLVFKVTKETTNIVVNGKKQKQLIVGKKVKIELK